MLEAWGPSGPCNEAAAAGHRDVHNGSMGSVGDFLVDTLTAQSLELPPQAAKVHAAMRIKCHDWHFPWFLIAMPHRPTVLLQAKDTCSGIKCPCLAKMQRM